MRRPIFFILFCIVIIFTNVNWCFDYCTASETKQINIILDNNTKEIECLKIINNSKFKNKYKLEALITKLENMGFNNRDILEYIDTELDDKINAIIKRVEREEKDSYLDVKDGIANIVEEQIGIVVKEEELFNDLISCLKNEGIKDLEVKTEKVVPDLTSDNIKNLKNLKSEFTTYIYGANQEGRIQNIKQAASKFNGEILMPGEKMSFNDIIGETNAENGYALAKVILNGKYSDDYGGGVCQVATTLYNSALLAGLSIDRVAPHSLKVGYVAGSFDAMVSTGVSDLVISNPLKTPVYIHSYATDYECGFKIFGEENLFDIVRRTEVLELSDDETEKIAFKSEGFLDYYKDGELVESKRIRRDKYKKIT